MPLEMHQMELLMMYCLNVSERGSEYIVTRQDFQRWCGHYRQLVLNDAHLPKDDPRYLAFDGLQLPL